MNGVKGFPFFFYRGGRKQTPFCFVAYKIKWGGKKNERTKNLKVVWKTLNIEVINFCEVEATMII